MAQSYEFIAQNYANQIESGKRTLDSIKDTLVRQRTEEILKERKEARS
jgi:hypothetical protein